MKTSRKVQNAWAMYDWANSTYNLVVGTAIFPIFYSAVTKNTVEGGAPDDVMFYGGLFKNTEVLSYCLAFGMFLVCLLTPALAGVADYLGRKKFFMRWFCYLGALSCASLFFFDMKHFELSMLSVILACVGYWCSVAFYNSFLPVVASPEEQDKLSAKGFSLGYIGSVLLLVINLVCIQAFDVPAKYAFLSVAVWWIGFAHYTFYHLAEERTGKKFDARVLANGFMELQSTWKKLKRTARLKRYLLAFFIFSMGVQTIMQMASLFGTKEVTRIDENGNTVVGLADGQLIVAVLLVQLIAIPGAMVFSYSSRKLGNLKTLKIALLTWAAVCIFAYTLVRTPLMFYIAAGWIGFIMGGTQALARSTYSKFLPTTNDHASYFSFYDVTEKVGLIIGLLSFGYLEGAFGSMRISILSLITFFVVGFGLLLLVPKHEKEVEGIEFEV